MERRNSFPPNAADRHNCDKLPALFPKNDCVIAPENLFYPTEACRIIRSDGAWYLIVQEELCFAIAHCPWCGSDLGAPTKNPLPPPPPVAIEEEDSGDENPIDIEAD